MVSLCNSPSCSVTQFADQASLELIEICLPLPAGIKGVCHHRPATYLFFETGSHCVVLAVLDYAMQIKLATNSQRSACLCLPTLGLKVCCHGSWAMMPSAFSLHSDDLREFF